MLPDDGDLGDPLPHHPAELVLRGDAIGLVLAGSRTPCRRRGAHLHHAEVLEVARHRRLGRATPSRASRSSSCGWLVDRLLRRSAWRSSCWRATLAAHGAAAPSEEAPARAAGRVHAVVALPEHAAAGPSITSAGDLEPAVRRQAVHEHGVRPRPRHQRVVHREAPERLLRARPSRPPGPSTSTCRCGRRRRRPPPRSARHTCCIDGTAPSSVDPCELGVGRLEPGRAARSATCAPSITQTSASERETLLKSPTQATVRPASGPNSDHRQHVGERLQRVARGRYSMLTIGTSATAAIRSSSRGRTPAPR